MSLEEAARRIANSPDGLKDYTFGTDYDATEFLLWILEAYERSIDDPRTTCTPRKGTNPKAYLTHTQKVLDGLRATVSGTATCVNRVGPDAICGYTSAVYRKTLLVNVALPPDATSTTNPFANGGSWVTDYACPECQRPTTAALTDGHVQGAEWILAKIGRTNPYKPGEKVRTAVTPPDGINVGGHTYGIRAWGEHRPNALPRLTGRRPLDCGRRQVAFQRCGGLPPRRATRRIELPRRGPALPGET